MNSQKRVQRNRKQRAGRWRLTLESLEPRLVLDSHIATALAAEPVVSDSPALVAFESEQQLRQYLIDAAVARYQGLFGQSTWSGWWPEMHLRSVSVADSVLTALPNGGTNVQHQGVDEGDFAKTDGSYLYHLGAQTLTIVDLRDPSNLQIAARVPLDQQLWSRELYVAGDRLTVISQRHGMLFAQPVLENAILDLQGINDWAEPRYAYDPTIHVAVYDIADRSEPKLLEQIEIEGTLQESRSIGSFVYLVTQESLELPYPETHCTTDEGGNTPPGSDTGEFPPGVPDWLMSTRSLLAGTSWDMIWPWPGPGGEKCVYESQEQYVERLADLDVLDLLPSLRAWDGEGNATADGLLVSVQDVYAIAGELGTNLATIVAIDLADDMPGASSQSVFLENVSEVYATESSIYLASTNWDWNVDSPTQHTAIARFGLEGAAVTPRSIGGVPGQPLNHFSLDEHDGYLRIATTQGWGDAARNQLYVLQETDGRLAIVGQLPDDLAEGERIFAARFLGDRAYLVTFRQVDPLFVVDLSDPTAPEVLGQLKLPGFSDYLQMLDDDLLLGFGRDADPETGAVGQPQLSLFDVSDPLTPQLADQFLFDVHAWSHSEAFYDHHAVGYFPAEGVLAVPVDTFSGIWEGWRERPADRSEPAFAFWVFAVTTTPGGESLELLGKIAHSSSGRRSFAVEGNLVTVSNEEVQVHPLRDPSTRLDRIALREAAVPDEYWLEAGTGPTQLDVLNNDRWNLDSDFTGISAVTAPSHGGTVVVSEDQRLLLYTPAPDFVGTETFTYSAAGESAEVQVHVEEYRDLIRIRLQPVDADGNEITTIAVGGEFFLNVFVEDLREQATGVFGAWVDIEYDAALASVADAIQHGTDYLNGISGSADVPGLVDEVGGFASLNRLGAGERLLVSIPMIAHELGMLVFEPNEADDLPAHDIGLFDLDRSVGSAEAVYLGTQLEVGNSLHNSTEATDTDGDGSTSPLDALRIVNFLNQYGAQSLATFRALGIEVALDAAAQAADAPRRMLYDVNGDGHVTPIDVLRVINRLNERTLGDGAGEFATLAASRQTALPGSDARSGTETLDELDHGDESVPRVMTTENRTLFASGPRHARSLDPFDGADELESILEELLSCPL